MQALLIVLWSFIQAYDVIVLRCVEPLRTAVYDSLGSEMIAQLDTELGPEMKEAAILAMRLGFFFSIFCIMFLVTFVSIRLCCPSKEESANADTLNEDGEEKEK